MIDSVKSSCYYHEIVNYYIKEEKGLQAVPVTLRRLLYCSGGWLATSVFSFREIKPLPDTQCSDERNR